MGSLGIDYQMKELNKFLSIERDLKGITRVLENLTSLMKSDQHRSQITAAHWKTSDLVAEICLQVLAKNCFEPDELAFLAEFFRFLRNSSAASSQNHNFIVSSNDILDCGRKVIRNFLKRSLAPERTVLKCCLQLFGNIVCADSCSKSLIWNILLEENSFKILFQHEDQQVQEYAMMVLYNCLCDENCSFLISTVQGHEILISLTCSLYNNLVDWGILILEVLMKQEQFLTNCYEILPMREKLLVLDIITEQVNSIQDSPYFFIPYASIKFIKKLFIQNVMNIVQVCNTESSDAAVEIVKLLSVLCASSVTDVYSSVLKTSSELLEISLDALRSVHFLGKKSCNVFSSISSLKLADQVLKEEIECHPSFGFKKNLIRLIGNMCYNCKDNQDLVRKLDGIPLLLDCCNLDARNPFIMQWCILAVRNILEKNSENQAVLASISVTGELADSTLIKELGFQVCSENGKCVLKSLGS